MAIEHDFIRATLDPRGAQPRWNEVLPNLHKVCRQPSAESVRVLRRILDLPADYVVALAPGYLPHAMSAADMLRSLAIQTLAHWDLEEHRAAIEQARDRSGSDIVHGIARAHLGR